MRAREISRKCALGGALVLAIGVPLSSAYANNYRVIYSFCSKTNCSDGQGPYAGLIADSEGNLYGTTYEGGASNLGTVFKLKPNGTETVLHSFDGSDGNEPLASLLADSEGNLYGTTQSGGTHQYFGTVFRLAPDGTETVLHSFGNSGVDGIWPQSGQIADKKGNLYGTTHQSGNGGPGAGIVFKLAPDGTETVLYSFCSKINCTDGALADTGLIRDKAGNLYGVTAAGGKAGTCFSHGCGVVFKVAPDGTETVLHTFCTKKNCADGGGPNASLVPDSSGGFYGTTGGGGASGFGTVYKLAADGTETVLYSFCAKGPPCADGAFPGPLIADKAGNFYGTSAAGGANTGCGDTYGCGTVFRLASDGTETVLYSFCSKSNCADGNPNGSIPGLMDGGLYLYGTVAQGGIAGCAAGVGCGVVFRIKK